ncbi:MAG: stage 0 sporulation family protein [Selenomonadaceae bacterium]
MQNVVGIRFREAGKIYYFSPGNLEIEKNDDVIVETARGVEYGIAVIAPRDVEEADVVLPLKTVQRKAVPEDRIKVKENEEKEKEAFKICEKKITVHSLPMKLIDVEYTFDVNKIIFYFTADGRIDFRELVKDLASVFRTRIELRQIGVRDEAKLMGGIGCCGRPLCCATFLGDFEPVSIRMAKDQNLSLNPTKISGICGRLMCCLKYENDCYSEACPRKKIVPPKQGSKVVSADGEGKVISLNNQRKTATILLDDSKTIVASWEDVVEKDESSAETE